MTAAPAVSVVVPAFNNADFIAATVDSILGQTFEDFELVIADHGSSDETVAIVSAYTDDPRVRLVHTDPGGGAQRNWNAVTDQAKGEYVKLVCGDDLVYPTCLHEQVQAMGSRPDVALVACRRDILDARGDVLIHGRGLPGLSGHVAGRDAIRATVHAGANIFGEPACVLMRTAAVRRAGGWSRSAEYLIDLDLYVRVLLQGDLYAVPSTLAAFRLSSTQWSVALARQQAQQTRGFYEDLRVAAPEVVSRLDVLLGSVRGYVNAAGRRILYQRWAKRLATA